MTKTLIGRANRVFFLALVFSVGLFALRCPDVFAVSSVADCPNGGTGYVLAGGACVPSDTGLSNKPVADIVYTFMVWLFGMIAVIAILAFAVSGLQYMTAAGDEKQIDTAKNAMKYATIGIAVSLSGYIAITAISTLLSADSMF